MAGLRFQTCSRIRTYCSTQRRDGHTPGKDNCSRTRCPRLRGPNYGVRSPCAISPHLSYVQRVTKDQSNRPYGRNGASDCAGTACLSGLARARFSESNAPLADAHAWADQRGCAGSGCAKPYARFRALSCQADTGAFASVQGFLISPAAGPRPGGLESTDGPDVARPR